MLMLMIAAKASSITTVTIKITKLFLISKLVSLVFAVGLNGIQNRTICPEDVVFFYNFASAGHRVTGE